MLPFHDYVDEGDTIYLAVHAKYRDRVGDILNSTLLELKDLGAFRLLFMVFSDRLEVLHLCADAVSIEDVLDTVLVEIGSEWHEGGALDPVIGMVMSDHASVRRRESPTLFLFSDGDVTTYWHESTLTQVVKFVWLNEPGESVSTRFGERREVLNRGGGSDGQ